MLGYAQQPGTGRAVLGIRPGIGERQVETAAQQGASLQLHSIRPRLGHIDVAARDIADLVLDIEPIDGGPAFDAAIGRRPSQGDFNAVGRLRN